MVVVDASCLLSIQQERSVHVLLCAPTTNKNKNKNNNKLFLCVFYVLRDICLSQTKRNLLLLSIDRRHLFLRASRERTGV